jgi:SWIM zinc finger
MLSLEATQIAQLAPDAAALKAGEGLAATTKWLRTGRDGRMLWGEIKGSGATPYQVAIDIEHPAYKCSCPSRKFPCKHGLGLMLMAARMGQSLPQHDPPEWATTWIAKRTGSTQQEAEPTEQDPAKAEKSAKDKTKRQESRSLNALSGAAELERWLTDLMRGGLLRLPEQDVSYFTKMMARMTDAQVTGLGAFVRELRDLDYANPENWQPKALDIVARAWLLLQAMRKLDDLSPLLQADVRSLAGFGAAPREVLADPDAERVEDHWRTAHVESEQLDDITVQRIWLIGCQTGRIALILQFSYRFNQPEVSPFTLQPYTTAELVYFPSAHPLRAVLRTPVPTRAPAQPIRHQLSGFEAVQTQFSKYLAQFPWLERTLAVVEALTLVRDQKQWWLRDQQGRAMPIPPDIAASQCYQILAITGGQPSSMIVWYDSRYVIPIASLHEHA